MRTKKEIPRKRRNPIAKSTNSNSDVGKKIAKSKYVPGFGKPGRPSIYDNARFPHIAYTLCKERGFTDADLAEVFGVSVPTFATWKRDNEDFRLAIRDGKDEWDGEHIENALLKRALGYEYEEVSKKTVKVNAQLPDGTKVKVPGIETTITTKVLVPDVKAITFWLINRNRERWKNISFIKAEGDGGGNDNTSTELSLGTDNLENLSLEQLDKLKEIAELMSGEKKQHKAVRDETINGLLEMVPGKDFQKTKGDLDDD